MNTDYKHMRQYKIDYNNTGFSNTGTDAELLTDEELAIEEAEWDKLMKDIRNSID